MKVKASAPGKIHLIGEHAVVYGFPAIIGAVGKRTVVEVEKSDNIEIKIGSFGGKYEAKKERIFFIFRKARKLWKAGYSSNDFSKFFKFIESEPYIRLEAMIGLILDSLEIKDGVSIEIKTDLPIGAGLGSSASMAVSMVKGISSLYKIPMSDEKINNLSFNLEELNHGRPSGGDNSVCSFGGLIWFEKKTTKSLLQPNFLNNIVAVYVQKPCLSTARLVQRVRKLKKEIRIPRIEAIGKASYELREALKEKDVEKFKYLINFTQKNLMEIGVSTLRIDKIAKRVVEIGGGAKLCGAGGGGNILCFHQEKEKLISLIKSLGLNHWDVKLGADGVRREST